MPKPGVMDPVALSARDAIRKLGFGVEAVKTGRKYVCEGLHDVGELRELVERHLANNLIEQVCLSTQHPFPEPAPCCFELKHVPVRDLDDRGLKTLSRQGHLFLDLEEMKAIRDHYRGSDREPTDVELETLAQTWSEHCVHKTLKSAVCYRGAGFPEEIRLGGGGVSGLPVERTYGNLLEETIVRATRELDKPWCLSVFEDNAGIIEFDEHHGVAFKVETHNHPSALEPYGGASTGVGGVIRDILGCGLGAKPVANTDVFCFADPSWPHDRLPAGVIHPARSMREVVRGVRDYGNRMGIPTVNGAIHFDDRFLANPLVYCGCVGVIPKDRIAKKVAPGDRIVLVGGRTGRDGIHGATFSSTAMRDTHADEFAHAVQIGNAITEKKVLDVLLQARDHQRGCLFHAITDCGAGGLSSAVGEMADPGGAVVDLDRVPLKYTGLRYDEIWISEAQERMVLAVAPADLESLLALCGAEDVEATDIGEFTSGGKLRLHYKNEVVGELEMEFLHHGLPKRQRQASWQPSRVPASASAETNVGLDIRSALLKRLADPNIASKEWVIRQYDHEVQGASVIKPLMGPRGGPSDGAVLRPVLNSERGIALSCGLCPGLSDIDPYVMAVAAFDEAVRNNVCVGGSLEHMAVLDNFCWGDVSDEHELGGLVRAAQACHDAALAYGLPFISGKDSLNNVFELDAREAQRVGLPSRISIPGTLLISAISVVADVQHCRSSDLKSLGNKVLLVRPTGYRLEDLARAAAGVGALLAAFDAIRSCHDCSDGGLLVAAAEMAIGSRYGLQMDLGALQSLESDDHGELLFGERLGSYLIEATPEAAGEIQKNSDVCSAMVGTVVETPELCLQLEGRDLVSWSADDLRKAWRSTFDWM